MHEWIQNIALIVLQIVTMYLLYQYKKLSRR